MKILIVGGGGREHALAWKCAQSESVSEVLVAPGNAGTALEPRLRNVECPADDIDSLIDLARDEQIGLTIVGPEVPLVAGIVDRFNEHGLRCFGPTADGAELEGSKTFTKEFLAQYKIPTAAYSSFTDVDEASAYILAQGAPIVIKADGLAAGKGVVVAMTVEDACNAATEMLAGGRFGDASSRIVVEEFLEGEEASFIVISDGKNVLPLATSQDHKARDEGDTGPNTGGMGAYSPAPVVSEEIENRIMTEVIEPTIRGLRDRGIHYVGFLYAGLMISADGTPRVIEFNCRMGDPETQPVMARLKSDLVELCQAAIDGRLASQSAEWDERAALGVVMAAGGYPESYRSGDIIDGLPEPVGSAAKVFHAGTAVDNSARIITSGGRVLCVVGLGNSVVAASQAAYSQAGAIGWQDAYYRKDIGYRAIARENGQAPS